MRKVTFAKWSLFAAAVLLLATLQFTPSFMPDILGNRPLYLIPAVVFIAMFEGERAGAGFGVAAGLIWDTQTGFAFGANALFLLVIGVCAGLLIEYLFRNTIVTGLFFTGVACLLRECLTWFFIEYMRGKQDFMFCALYIILPTLGYTMLLAVPIYFLLRRLSLRFAGA